MNKDFNLNSKQLKNNNDKYYEIYRYFQSMSQKESSAFQELLNYTLKNECFKRKK